jgi:hypothetical protein
MTIAALEDLLRAHLAALRSSAWPTPHGPAGGPVIYLDRADTETLIAQLARLQDKLAAARESAADSASEPKSEATTSTLRRKRPPASVLT